MPWTHELEQNPEIVFGFYMRPSPDISQAQAMVHDLLRRQFGLVAGGRFMPHATIKGFFRSDAPVAEIVAACDRAVAGQTAIPIVNNGVLAFGNRTLVLNVHHNEAGERNEALYAFHNVVHDQILPLVHPECRFSTSSWSREQFFAHLTLAMADVPAFAFDEIYEFVRELEPLGRPRFLAKYFHLYAFHSANWSGAYWHDMTWQLLNTWKLPEAAGARV